MKPFLAIACLVVIALATTSAVRADVAKPKPTQQTENKSIYSSLEIIPDSKATNAKLQIRQSDLNELRAAIEGMHNNTALAANITRSGTRTIIAGLLLFLSVSLGGVWLARAARSNSGLRRSQKAVAIALITVATLGAAAIITRGNAGPPPAYRWRNLPTALAAGQSTAGSVIIEVVPDDPNSGSGMKLIIPLKKQNSRGEDE
jgi:heme A synthase